MDHVTGRPHDRLAQKVDKSTLGFPENPTVNWMLARIVTPGGLCGYRNGTRVEFFKFRGDGSVQLFPSGVNSQGLVFEDNQVVAASVNCNIRSQTQRRDEGVSTYVQYDKRRVEQSGKDFAVDPTNYRGWVNYQGGHLIDHKYSAGGSHYDEKNYIPAHYFYNAPLKEYLVQRCDAYVEIPLYTPNPPMIGVKGHPNRYHEIPVGIIFVQLSNNAIQDIYYFPNNDFDYQGLKTELGLRKDIAENMAPYFKLKRCFRQLLRPALITDFDSVEDGMSKQAKRESNFFETFEGVSLGMSLAECSEEQWAITRLSFGVLHEEYVDPSLYLDWEEGARQLQEQPLAPAFNALGEFLVFYGLRNALKSEVISVKSRLVFVNVVCDFIEASMQVSKEALAFIDSLAPEFESTLDELNGIAETMGLEELIYLANTYQRLSSEFNHPFSLEDHDIYGDGDLEYYFNKAVWVLRIITSRFSVDSFNEELGLAFLNCVRETKGVLEYLRENFDEEEFEDEGVYLSSIGAFCSELLTRLSREDSAIIAGFRTGIGKIMRIWMRREYLEGFF